jgi:hypothetical protein
MFEFNSEKKKTMSQVSMMKEQEEEGFAELFSD